MTMYYAHIMYRDQSGNLEQEFHSFGAKSKAEAKKKGKEFADSKNARLVGVYLENTQN